MSSLYYYIFVAAVISVVLQKATSARINISPDGFVEAVTDSVFVTCTPDGTSARAKEILVIEISKDGNTPIVLIEPPSRIQYGNQKTDHYQAVGVVNNTDIPNSFLNLTIIYPSKDDAGTYTCVMSYIDEMGLVKQDTSIAILKLNASDHSSVDNRLNNLETAIVNLLARIKDLEKDNKELQEENTNQTTQIQILREKTDYPVAFSAAINAEMHITTGDILVFSDVMINEGFGYNATTGIFTAPRAGLYSFHLVLEVGQGGAVGEICLSVAGKDMAKMYVQDKDFGDQGAITAVSRLKAGDNVKVVVFSANGNNPRVFSERLCVFSGFLIQT